MSDYIDQLEERISRNPLAFPQAEDLLRAIGRVRVAERRLAERDVRFAAVLTTEDFTVHGIRAEFTDTTQLVDTTRMGAAERELIEGVQSWRLTIESDGPQPMTPGRLLYWLEKHAGRELDLRVSR